MASETKGASKTAQNASTNPSPILKDTRTPTPSFLDKLYEKTTSVIGGNNPNQFFCLSLPGTLIEPSRYTYAVEEGEPKPAHVEANESKLVNKLFNACQIAVSDNGRHLTTQYKTALDVLTPKLNGKLFEAKTKLREVLMMPYPYNFGDGSNDVLTLEQVFYCLYEDYVSAKQAWATKQLDKKNELAKKYPGESAADYQKREDLFLEWYETTAEAEVLLLEEKLGKALSIFSPGDIEIINGILDSGAGRELAEARATLTNSAKMNPDGGLVYPVNLYPENWFTLLDTSFTPYDLLESPNALAQKSMTLLKQRSAITANINSFLSIIPDQAEVQKLKQALDENEKALKEAVAALQSTYGNAALDMVKTLLDVMAARNINDPDKLDKSFLAKILGLDSEIIPKILDKFKSISNNLIKKQNDLIEKAKKATSASLDYFTKNNLLQYKNMLAPLQQQLAEINAELSALQEKTVVASAVCRGNCGSTAPNKVPDNFTQIIITSRMSEAKQQSSSYASSSQSHNSVSFFLGGYSNSSSHQEAVKNALDTAGDMSIEIGMSVAKVQIGREWFNPGVFLLTRDMYNTSSEPIAPSKEYTGFHAERFEKMNQSLFPCYPTAFVVARDITIKFSLSAAISETFAQSVEEHAASGGGFFIFSGSSSSASASSSSNAVARSMADGITVRFTNPQILGYYLEALPADHSTPISAKSNSDKDFISIFEFITAFESMLDEHAKKHDSKTA